MNINEQDDFKRVVAFFWGERNAKRMPMNEYSVAAVVEVLEAAGACSETMDLVPRPHTSFARPAYSYAIQQIKNIAKNIAFGNSGLYISCKNSAAYTMKHKITAIMSGIY